MSNKTSAVVKTNPRKAVMIGCGFVGSASVFALMQSGLFSEIVLIDADKDKAEGEAMVPLCLFQDRGCFCLKRGIHIPCKPTHVALCARHIVPIAKAQLVANRSQDESSAWRVVML